MSLEKFLKQCYKGIVLETFLKHIQVCEHCEKAFGEIRDRDYCAIGQPLYDGFASIHLAFEDYQMALKKFQH